MALISNYVRALREEPKARTYLAASIVDDAGVAVSGWAGALLMTNLFVDQRARASVMLPSLLCFLVGALVAGPLADWERSQLRLGAYRWKIVVWGRLVETLGLVTAVVSVAHGPTLSNILPYMLLSAFMKTGLLPTREAFFVDLLQKEELRVDRSGAVMHDESGRPLKVKTHVLSFESLLLALRSGSAFLGLVLGGILTNVVHGRYEILFAVDVTTNLVFIALVAKLCHPDHAAREVRWRELLAVHTEARGALALLASGAHHFVASARELAGYLKRPEVRPLVWILFGDWLVEVIDEFYSGEMMIKHILHGSDDVLRYAKIAWALSTVVALVLVPALARRMGSLGRLFVVAMALDGLVMVMAGHVAMRGSAGVLLPFVGILSADRALTATSGALSSLATATSSGAAIRGRIFAVVPVLAILGDILAEMMSTPIAEAYGVAPMLRGLGVAQVVLVVGMLAAGGAAFWRYGIVTRPEKPALSAASGPDLRSAGIRAWPAGRR